MEVRSSSVELRVLLADHQAPTRAGVRVALEAQGLRVVGEVSNAPEAVRAALQLRPDVCLLTVNIPGDGIAAAAQIHTALPDTKIVMLSESESDEDLFASVRAGAVGFLLKTMTAERLPHALRGVAQGEAALPRMLTARVLGEFREIGRRRLALSSSGTVVELTPREFEVLQLFRQTKSTAEIAGQLHISEVTVRRHVSAIVRKLDVADRQSALELLRHDISASELDRNGT